MERGRELRDKEKKKLQYISRRNGEGKNRMAEAVFKELISEFPRSEEKLVLRLKKPPSKSRQSLLTTIQTHIPVIHNILKPYREKILIVIREKKNQIYLIRSNN